MIRNFRNADLPLLHRIWCEHWDSIGLTTRATSVQFEQAIFSRLFFNPTDLLISEVDGQIVGWCQRFLSRSSSNELLVPYLLLDVTRQQSDQIKTVNELLDACSAASTYPSDVTLVVGTGHEWDLGYCGLDPLVTGFGIPDIDHALSRSLSESGLTIRNQIRWLQLAVENAQPVISREFMQFRRSYQVTYQPLKSENLRRSQSLSHLDAKQIQLTDRMGRGIAQVEFFLSELQAEVMSPTHCLLRFADENYECGLKPEQLYLISTLVRDSKIHQFDKLNIAIPDHCDSIFTDQLRSLQFQEQLTGSTWER